MYLALGLGFQMLCLTACCQQVGKDLIQFFYIQLLSKKQYNNKVSSWE